MTSPDVSPSPSAEKCGPVPSAWLPAAILIVCALVVAGCGSASGGAGAEPELHVHGAVVAVPAGSSTAAYLEIENGGDAADSLVEISSEAGSRIELHEMAAGEGGLAIMREVHSVEIPAQGAVSFRPGGYHVMIIDPEPLEEGETVELVLVFERSGSLRVEAEVRAYGSVLDG